MRRWLALLALLGAVAGACTGSSPSPLGTGAPPGSSPSGTAAPGPAPLTLDVVAGTGATAGGASSYLDGMAVAVAEANTAGGVAGRSLRLVVHDDGGDAARAGALLAQIEGGPGSAALVVGPGSEVLLARQAAASGKPIVLLEGDLYTAHQLFPQVFQAGIPWAWQAKVLARYLVKDRKAATIGFVGTGPEARTAATAAAEAVAYWGGRLAWSATVPGGLRASDRLLARAGGADAVLVSGGSADIGPLVRQLQALPRPPRIAAAETLLASGLHPAPGTTACWSYPWAGWDPPIPRVRSFVRLFREHLGRPPTGLDQEGYDAVRALVSGLRATHGRGGAALGRALERLDPVTFSGFPIALGPDDHVLMPRDELGLFAVAGPREALDPWQRAWFEPWRALMRTFTYDGVKTNVADLDRRVFFPGWRKNRPGPVALTSRYGITTGPADPLH